jgi:hypothetical protein
LDDCDISNEEGGCDMYRDDMVPPLTSPSIDFPLGRASSDPDSSRIAATSTRFSGHGISCEGSLGRDGELFN